MPLLEPVSIFAGDCLAQAGDTLRFVCLPESAVLSCQANMQDGKSAEVGVIGFEGLADVTSLNGARPAVHSLNVSIGGRGLRMKKEDFERELLRGDGLQQSLLAYTAEYVTQVSQRSACAIFHLLEER